jgi:hypothetical protein
VESDRKDLERRWAADREGLERRWCEDRGLDDGFLLIQVTTIVSGYVLTLDALWALESRRHLGS